MRSLRTMTTVLVLGLGLACVLTGCSFLGNAFGTGATPYTREVEVMVVGNVAGTANQVPVPSASVTVTQVSSNQSATGGSSAGSSSASQTMGTGPDGRVLFRIEPGESYTVVVSASGYSSSTIVISASYYGPELIQRVVTLASSSATTTP